jgi:hypothetical protein
MAKKPKKNPQLAQEIRAEIKKWDDYWRFNRTQYHEWMDFVFGDMWKEDESKVFTRYNKIPMTCNKMAPLAAYMLGEQRQNTPQLQTCPSEDTPLELVEIRDSLMKHIVHDSDSKIAYQWAFQCAVVGGYGAFGHSTDYEDTHSFNQELKVDRIQDPTRCYWDVAAESPCKTDGMLAGKRTRMSRKMFREKYGKKIEEAIPSSSYTEDTSLMSFSDDDTITVIDHYKREYDTVTIYQLSNERVVEEDVYDKLERIQGDDGEEYLFDNGEIVSVVNERETYRFKVIHQQIAGDYLLEEEEFPSEQLPIVFVDQNSYWDKNQKQICRPFFKDAKDAQRYLNYLFTQSAYIIKVSRYDQYIASKANVKSPDTQAIWRDPATQQGALIYDESPNGNKPEKQTPSELPISLLTQYERCLHDIESCTGIYGTQIGQQGNENSGKAIDARTQQGAYNTYVPYDSLNRAIACSGQIINEAIPRVYDTKRQMVLRMSDQNMQPVTLNNPRDEYGTAIDNDMTKGRYKIRLLPGPNSEGQKEQARESMQMILQADPTLFRLFGDMYVESLPMQNNIELRNRIRTIIPPDIIEAGKTGKPLPPKPQQEDPMVALKRMAIQLQAKQIENQRMEAQEKARAKIQELQIKQMELSTKVNHDSQATAMEWQRLEAEKLEAAAKLQEQEMRFQSEMARIQTDADMSHAENISKLLIHAGEVHHQKDIKKLELSQPRSMQ